MLTREVGEDRVFQARASQQERVWQTQGIEGGPICLGCGEGNAGSKVELEASLGTRMMEALVHYGKDFDF